LDLNDRVKKIAVDLANREQLHRTDIDRAQSMADDLHARVDTAIGLFNEAVAESVPYLEVAVSSTRVDDKHLHAVEFNLERGRHRAVVTVKSKGVVTLVGPFRAGKKEGPCLSFPMDAREDIDDALGDFLERFLEEAASP
jgi:hypothetical protein